MNNRDFEGIMEGLAEATAFVRGEDVPGIRVHHAVSQVRLGTEGERALRERHRLTGAATFATTNIVIHAKANTILAEDFSVDSPGYIRGASFTLRAARFIDTKHVRVFSDDRNIDDGADDAHAMRKFTAWLHEVGAIVDKCWIIGETLSDEERQAGVLRPTS